MSDVDEPTGYQNTDMDAVMQDGTEEYGDANAGSDDRPPPDAVGDEEEDEEEEDEDEEDEEDEEEEESGRKGKRAKRRHHQKPRNAASRFLDLQAEVSDEDEEDEDEDEEVGDGFIETTGDDDDTTRRHHALLDSQRHFDEEDKSPEQIARDLTRRYVGRAAVRYTGDMNEVPQRLLMPSVHDASLWQVRVKPGRERDLVFSIMRKSIDVEYTARPLQVLSAFQRDSLTGMIYVEARSSQQVLQACNGLVGIYPSRGINLVPIEEMASLLQIKKQDMTVTLGSWVRIRRGKYLGDLGQVFDITENGEEIGIKFVPRIDLNPRDDGSLEGAGRKRKKAATGAGTMRPPQRLFNYEEVVKVHGKSAVVKRNHSYVFGGDTYKDGFVEKDFKLSGLILEDVNPSLDEITQFTRRQDGAEADNAVDLSIIAEASRKAAISVLQPGDHVEVFEGEQAGVHGVVEEISQDVVTITASGVDLDGQKVDLPARSVRKRFKPGDHVKVMAGKNVDETGLVVAVAESVVTFISDMSMQEVSVFSKDLREAAETGISTNKVGEYELHDLVQLDLQTVGVIFKTERDSFRVLDQNGQVRLVQPHQISMRRDSIRAIATDSEGHELRINDMVKEVDGEGRKGQVIHIHQSFFAFLHNRDILENGGVFVTRTRSLASLAPKGNVVKAGMDLSKMNPSLAVPSGGMVGSGAMGRGPRDRHIGVSVVVIKGSYKGYVGTVKDTNGNVARVELNTNNKIISIDKEKLHRRQPNGSTEPLTNPWRPPREDNPMAPPSSVSGGRSSNPYNTAGSRTPGWGGGRTPNPYAAETSRTPAWNASSRTPNPYAANQTPAWNASSRTPNPYADGGRTPAWSANSRTPNPYANGGGATPARPTGGWGGATPARTGGGGWGSGDAWGGASPARPQPWGADSGSTWNAATPAANAATPGFLAANTPAASAFTPAAYMSAATPAAGITSGHHSSMSAPTPGYYGSTGLGDSDENEVYELPEDWLLDGAFIEYQSRLKVKIEGTRNADNYLEGVYESKLGRITGALRVGAAFDQTAMVQFEDGESRSIRCKYIVQVQPQYVGEEAIVLNGKHKGQAVKVLEAPEELPKVTVRTLDPNMTAFIEVPKDQLAVLWPAT